MADSETNDPADPGFQDHEPTSQRLQHMDFPVVMRGYDRDAVDEYVHNVQAELAHLEANQTPQGAVKQRLDDVGVETAGILQQAYQAAEELATRSQIEADERLQGAQNEADQLRREADEYSEQIIVDTRALWDERLRLIEDIRQLADQVLATADEAIERLQMPEPLAVAEAESEPTTAETPAGGLVEVPVEEAGGPHTPGLEDEPALDDTAAWGVGEVEAEPPEAQTGAYEETEETEAYGSVPPDEDPGHTVELEALPGGAGEDEESPPEHERSWDRERD